VVFGRPKVPAALRALFDKEERLLALADDDATAVAATQRGLWLPQTEVAQVAQADPVGPATTPGSGPGWRRVEWHRVVKATWTEAGLEVTEGVPDPDGVVADQPPLRYRLTEPRNLPQVVRQRVERSIGRWEQVKVPGGTGRIVGRREPGVDGITWTARIDSGTPDSPEARAVLRGYLERVRALPVDETADF